VSAAVLNRHLAEARATPPAITLTAHDVANLVRIRDAGPCRTLSAVLSEVLEAAARAAGKDGRRWP
jgi:hypothetical protein